MYIAEYDKISAERVQVEKEMVDNEDDDGWKTVTKKYIFINFNLIIISFYRHVNIIMCKKNFCP